MQKIHISCFDLFFGLKFIFFSFFWSDNTKKSTKYVFFWFLSHKYVRTTWNIIHSNKNCICFRQKIYFLSFFSLQNWHFGHKKIMHALSTTGNQIFSCYSFVSVNFDDKNPRSGSCKQYFMCRKYIFPVMTCFLE